MRTLEERIAGKGKFAPYRLLRSSPRNAAFPVLRRFLLRFPLFHKPFCGEALLLSQALPRPTTFRGKIFRATIGD